MRHGTRANRGHGRECRKCGVGGHDAALCSVCCFWSAGLFFGDGTPRSCHGGLRQQRTLALGAIPTRHAGGLLVRVPVFSPWVALCFKRALEYVHPHFARCGRSFSHERGGHAGSGFFSPFIATWREDACLLRIGHGDCGARSLGASARVARKGQNRRRNPRTAESHSARCAQTHGCRRFGDSPRAGSGWRPFARRAGRQRAGRWYFDRRPLER